MNRSKFFLLCLCFVLFVNLALLSQQKQTTLKKIFHKSKKKKLPVDVMDDSLQEFAEKKNTYSRFYWDTITKQIFVCVSPTKKCDTLAILNHQLFEEVCLWMGTKYKYAGESSQGIDCSALINQLVWKAYHINMPRSSAEQAQATTTIKAKEVREGDLVFFKIRRRRKKRISHVGLMLNDTYFIHASSSQGVIISNMNDPYYQKAKSKFGRVPLSY